MSCLWLGHTCVPTTPLFSHSAKYPWIYSTHNEWRAPEKVEGISLIVGPGGLIFHSFANGLLQCVHCAAYVTIPLGVAADRRIGMPAGLDLASRSFLKQNSLNFFWCSPFIVCAVDSWILRRMWEQGCGWHTSVSQPQTWHGGSLNFIQFKKFLKTN